MEGWACPDCGSRGAKPCSNCIAHDQICARAIPRYSSFYAQQPTVSPQAFIDACKVLGERCRLSEHVLDTVLHVPMIFDLMLRDSSFGDEVLSSIAGNLMRFLSELHYPSATGRNCTRPFNAHLR